MKINKYKFIGLMLTSITIGSVEAEGVFSTIFNSFINKIHNISHHNVLKDNDANNNWTLLSANTPVEKSLANAWTDNQGNAYLLIGVNGATFNDLWQYNIGSATWTQITQPAVAPTSRMYATTWTDNEGNAYLFGGFGASSGYFNDLWKYNMSSNTWTQIDQNNANASNQPTARMYTTSWVDNQGNAYVFGGFGNINDLWQYNMANNTWTQINENNVPTARFGEASWVDNQGNAYIFGGWNNVEYLNDMWK
jgi:N-acetylneuraminic acid mutarotase